MMMNARQGAAAWNVGQAGAFMFEIGLRAFTASQAERNRADGTAMQVITERAQAAATGRRTGPTR